ncbi:inverse autotransporter beta domain-containing protein [Rahnella contaminans]|uniref:inverse autotransporter beta domain-containing protein n=2 Tax=Yersiniaceae TaxID=1903411 RepID=UPI003CC5B237
MCTNFLKLSGNYSIPLSAWKASADFDNDEERPAPDLFTLLSAIRLRFLAPTVLRKTRPLWRWAWITRRCLW